MAGNACMVKCRPSQDAHCKFTTRHSLLQHAGSRCTESTRRRTIATSLCALFENKQLARAPESDSLTLATRCKKSRCVSDGAQAISQGSGDADAHYCTLYSVVESPFRFRSLIALSAGVVVWVTHGVRIPRKTYQTKPRSPTARPSSNNPRPRIAFPANPLPIATLLSCELRARANALSLLPPALAFPPARTFYPDGEPG